MDCSFNMGSSLRHYVKSETENTITYGIRLDGAKQKAQIAKFDDGKNFAPKLNEQQQNQCVLKNIWFKAAEQADPVLHNQEIEVITIKNPEKYRISQNETGAVQLSKEVGERVLQFDPQFSFNNLPFQYNDPSTGTMCFGNHKRFGGGHHTNLQEEQLRASSSTLHAFIGQCRLEDNETPEPGQFYTSPTRIPAKDQSIDTAAKVGGGASSPFLIKGLTQSIVLNNCYDKWLETATPEKMESVITANVPPKKMNISVIATARLDDSMPPLKTDKPWTLKEGQEGYAEYQNWKNKGRVDLQIAPFTVGDMVSTMQANADLHIAGQLMSSDGGNAGCGAFGNDPIVSHVAQLICGATHGLFVNLCFVNKEQEAETRKVWDAIKGRIMGKTLQNAVDVLPALFAEYRVEKALAKAEAEKAKVEAELKGSNEAKS